MWINNDELSIGNRGYNSLFNQLNLKDQIYCHKLLSHNESEEIISNSIHV